MSTPLASILKFPDFKPHQTQPPDIKHRFFCLKLHYPLITKFSLNSCEHNINHLFFHVLWASLQTLKPTLSAMILFEG